MAPSQEEDQVPIYVPYQKLADWLVDRKQLPTNWHEKLKDVKVQVQQALAGLEEGGGEVAAWVKGKENSLHYYTCQQIMSLLEGAQQGRTKNIFGSYTVAVLKTWDGILRAYRKENLYLGEAARLLATQTTYTCPGLRRRIAGWEKQVEDCDRRVGEYRKAIREGEARFQAACREWGVSPKDHVEGEEEGGEEGEGEEWKALLVEVARKELPGMMEEVERVLCAEGVGEALEYYQQVWRFLHSFERKEQQQEEGGKEETGKQEEEETNEFFPVLCKVRRGEKLLQVECEVEGEENRGEEGQEAVEIDWGAEMSAGEGMTIEGGGEGIDWGEDGEGEGEGENGIGGPTTAHEIEWNVTATSSGNETSPQHAPPQAAAATSNEIKTDMNGQGGSLLADAFLRGALLNELLELEAFLRQRRLEVGDSDNVVFVGQYHGQHAALQQQSVGMVDRYLAAIRLALSGLREKRLQQLWLVRSSPVYVERLVQGLRQHRRRVRKLEKAWEETEVRREEAVEALGWGLPEYEATAAATKTLKRKVEVSLRELFNERKILITGGVNTL